MKKWQSYSLLAVIFCIWVALVFFVPPSQIVEVLGVNTFAAVFIAGVLGGTSILFPFPYYLIVVTAAAGGANPFLVGLFSGLGVAVGDSTSYLIGYAGRAVLPKKATQALRS